MSFEKMKINEEPIHQFLSGHFQGQVSELVLLSGGEWSQAFAFKHSGKGYVQTHSGMHC